MAQIAAHPWQGLLPAEADGRETFPVLDPATGQEIAHVARMGAEETRRAIDAAMQRSDG